MKDLDCSQYEQDVARFVFALKQQFPPLQRAWSCIDRLYRIRILSAHREVFQDPVGREEAYYNSILLLRKKLLRDQFVPQYSDAILRFLLRTFRYKLSRQLRFQQRLPLTTIPGQDIPEYEEALSPDQDHDAVFRVQVIEEMLAELPPRYQEFVRLFILEGYDREEIVQIMKLPSRGAYQNLMRRALDRFREMYNRWKNEGRI